LIGFSRRAGLTAGLYRCSIALPATLIYDIANLVTRQWPTIGPDLHGKIHVIVGTADTFYLDGAAHKLQAALDALHADAHFTFVPDRSHFNLYKIDDDPRGLLDRIAAEMYAVARPHSHR
jgi:dienelactone hydrolase